MMDRAKRKRERHLGRLPQQGVSVCVMLVIAGVTSLAGMGCGGGNSSSSSTPICDQTCRDGTALRALRETMKLVFNLTLQGKPVGMQDQTTRCPQGGTVRVYGEATSNAVQGATHVKLTYVFDGCSYMQKESTPERNYHMTLNGTITEEGALAVQPSATTALVIRSSAVTLSGTVYDPPIDNNENNCALDVTQDGNTVSGMLCGRVAGFGF